MFGFVSSKKMEIFKQIWSNFEIYLRPLKFSLKNLRPLIFLSKNFSPLKKHSGRVFPINNVHPLIIIIRLESRGEYLSNTLGKNRRHFELKWVKKTFLISRRFSPPMVGFL